MRRLSGTLASWQLRALEQLTPATSESIVSIAAVRGSSDEAVRIGEQAGVQAESQAAAVMIAVAIRAAR